jgi:aspartate racemase
MPKTVGILGGMGPMATVDLFAKIVQSTPASIDQEHLRIIIDNNPQVPSRVNAIMHAGESPLAQLTKSARVLEKAGVDFIVMPCNTAHYWIEKLQRSVNVPILNMITCAAAYAFERYPQLSGRILLFATIGTVHVQLYQKAFSRLGMLLQVPTPEEQQIVDTAIDAVKAGQIESNPFLGQLDAIIRKHEAQGVLAGCTEIPLVFPSLKESFTRLDATAILAEAAVKEALTPMVKTELVQS